MNLVDILARELKAWPEGVSKIMQSFAGMTFYQDEADQIVPLHRFSLSDDWRSDAGVTREQWQAAVEALNGPAFDWSKGPEDATHFGDIDKEAGFLACWYKKVDGLWFGWLKEDDSKWDHVPAMHGRFAERRIASLIERPVQTAWNGEGLPPVGAFCKLSGPTERFIPLHPAWAGREVKIYAHFVSDNGTEMAAYVSEDHQIGGVGIAVLFRPIRTPEQIAAEAKLKEWIVGIESVYGKEAAEECRQILARANNRKTEILDN